jgi:hypothetical protein
MRRRAELAKRLRERGPEIEEAVMARVVALAGPPERGGSEYAQGLRAAVVAGVSYGIEGLAPGEREPPDVPEALLGQARLAARSGVGLDTVLRRYVAGHALLGDFLVQEAEGFSPAELKSILRRLAASLDLLLGAVTVAHRQEQGRRRRGGGRRRAETVERLLAGEPLDAPELDYELNAHHVGLVASGPGAAEALETLAAKLDRRLLLVCAGERVHWAWIGGRREFDPGEFDRLREVPGVEGLRVALGEPGVGSAGWRLTHQQALAALSIAIGSEEPVVRYRDVALLAGVAQDDLLATSLRRLYLEPLESERDGGEALRMTLRAYFACDRSVSSSAAALGVSRQTVTNRLRTVERRIGRSFVRCSTEIEVALWLSAR